ncbi:trypsin-like peptidase domain-containing protein [Comamonas humi]
MNWWTQNKRLGTWCAVAAAAAVLAACGGGSDDGDNGTPPVGPTTYVLDSVVLPASAIKSTAALSEAVRPAAATLVLPEWSEAKQAPVSLPGMPMQIGAPRSVPATQTAGGTSQTLQWTQAPGGGQVAALSITSSGAYGVRLGVVVTSLPDAAQIRLYRQDRSQTGFQTTGQAINEALARNVAADGDSQAARTWWSPDLEADEVTLEIALPAGVSPAQVQIAIPTLSHTYVNLALPLESDLQDGFAAKNVGDSGRCELDASCADQYNTERNAVARMTFVGANGGSFYCTGTLLNNTKKDYAPYFLSANHCISTQASATSLRTDWFFRSASCNSAARNPLAATRQQGATLLYATSVTDTTLMRLNEMPPVGVTLAGWDARSSTGQGTGTYGLHHPVGDLLKYSEGPIQSYAKCNVGGEGISCSAGDSQSDFYVVKWSKGVTEGGSSGSAIFTGGRVVGTLTGGSSACTAGGVANGGIDAYGRFDHAFNNKLKDWLAQ